MKTLEGLDMRTDEPELVAGALAGGALALARRFAAGSTMWCIAPQWPAHGRHIAVEFVHPVVVGKRALAAVNVEAPDPSGALRLLARPGDVLLAVSTADESSVNDVMRRSEAWGMTRFWLGAGPAPPPSGSAEHVIWIESADPAIAARSGDMVLLYHLLWELTHVVFEHPGLLEQPSECTDDVCITCSDEGVVAEVRIIHDETSVEVVAAGRTETIDASLVEPVEPGDLVLVHAGVALTTLTRRIRLFSERRTVSGEATGFLYPFIDSEERDSLGLVADLAASARSKIADSRELRAATIEQCDSEILQVTDSMSERFCRGGRLFAFGNGGSATDAEGIVELFGDPPWGRALPAMSLVDDLAVITALANDVGFDLVFSRQIMAFSRPDDIAIGFSTSGDSPNVLKALGEARTRRLLTVGLAGYEGGAMAASDAVDHCFVVRSESVHRIQEAQNSIVLRLWESVQRCLDERCAQ